MITSVTARACSPLRDYEGVIGAVPVSLVPIPTTVRGMGNDPRTGTKASGASPAAGVAGTPAELAAAREVADGCTGACGAAVLERDSSARAHSALPRARTRTRGRGIVTPVRPDRDSDRHWAAWGKRAHFSRRGWRWTSRRISATRGVCGRASSSRGDLCWRIIPASSITQRGGLSQIVGGKYCCESPRAQEVAQLPHQSPTRRLVERGNSYEPGCSTQDNSNMFGGAG